MKRRIIALGIVAVFAIFGFYACNGDDSVDATLDVRITSGATLDREGGTATIEVTSNSAWTVSVNQTWATPSVTSGQNDATFNVTVPANDGAGRTVVVTVRVSDALQRTVTINQNGETPATENLTVSIASGNPIAATGGTVTINVQSNTTWNVSANASWAVLSAETGENNGSFNVVVAAYDGVDDRNATITVQTTASTITRTVDITQRGTPIPVEGLIGDLLGEWEVTVGYVNDGQSWYLDQFESGLRTVTIIVENLDENVIRIQNFGGMVQYIGVSEDYVLATVNEENNTIRIHSMVELAPADPVQYPDTAFSFYMPLYDVDAAGNNVDREWWDMPITGQPGSFTIDLAGPLEADEDIYFTYGFADMDEVNGVQEFSGVWVFAAGQIFTQGSASPAPAPIKAMNAGKASFIKSTKTLKMFM